MFKKNIKKLSEFLNTPKKIVIIPHKNPDGDALGSCFAWAAFLLKKKHFPIIVSPNEPPYFLDWLPQKTNKIKLIIQNKQAQQAEKVIMESELIFTLDFNSLNRTGHLESILKKSKTPKIMIDHHENPGNYAALLFSYPKLSSTCELVFNIINALDINVLDKQIGTFLYTGIMTDTGSFRFPSTTKKTHKIISKLLSVGVKNHRIHEKIYDSYSLDKIYLLKTALNNLVEIKGINTVFITLTQKELNNANFKKGDADGFVNYGLSIKNIKVSVIMIENKKENYIKLSFRSKGSFDVNIFAKKYFNGGGHKNAAGGISFKSIEDTVKEFKEKITLYKKKLC